MKLTPLQQLTAGQEGRLSEIRGPATLIHRLEEVGLRRGSLLRVLHPGAPCIVSINGQKLTYRDHRTQIMVDVLSPA